MEHSISGFSRDTYDVSSVNTAAFMASLNVYTAGDKRPREGDEIDDAANASIWV